jgi:hypothetical protein
MEKILYIVWKHEGDSEADFRQKLLEKVSPQLIESGARRLRIGVVDEDVAPAAALRMGNTKPPITGLISIWADTSTRRQPFEEAIQGYVARLAGYLS